MKTKGFTLVELLIAITISTIVMGAALYAFTAGMRVYSRVSTAESVTLEELNLFRALQNDISSAVPLGDDNAFTGSSTTMSFTRLVSPNNSTNNIAPVRVEWSLAAGRAERRTDRLEAYRTDCRAFQYHDATQWRDTWDAPGYPAQVRVGETVFTLWTTDSTESK